MRLLILGGTGFCGRHLALYCQQLGDTVFYTGRKPIADLDPTALRSLGTYLQADVTKPESLRQAILDSKPQAIIHLAGLASVAHSFQHRAAAYEINVIGTLNVLETARELTPQTRILVAGSAEEYGQVLPQDLPLREDSPLRPRSPYGVSKAAASLMALREGLDDKGLDVLVTRTFNLTGPGQSDTFIASDFAHQVAKAAAAKLNSVTLNTGNLQLRRDFSPINLAVTAYRALIDHGQRGLAYNLCSGRAIPLSFIVDSLANISGLQISTSTDPKRLRGREAPELRGDPSRLLQATNISLDQIDTLEHAIHSLYLHWYKKYVS